MKFLFFDTNILIDFLADKKPFSEGAAILFTYASEKKARIYCSAISFNNIYYLFRKTQTHKQAIKTLTELADMTEIISANTKVINQALQSDFKDFEDAIQYFSALTISNLDGIVTRNTKDFSKSQISLLTPHEAVGLFSSS